MSQKQVVTERKLRNALKLRKEKLIQDMLREKELLESHQSDYDDLQVELEEVCERLGEDVSEIEELQD
jgi:hypothetical protein